MRRKGHSCTSALNNECKINFSVYGFVQNLNFFSNLAAFWTILATFSVKSDSMFELYMPDFL